MLERSVRRAIAVSPTHSIAGYRVGMNTEYGNGLMDGLILLIAAVAQQALKEKCKCDGCMHWINLYKEWGMGDNEIAKRVQTTAVTEQRYYQGYGDE